MRSLNEESVSKKHDVLVVLSNGGEGVALDDEELNQLLDFLKTTTNPNSSYTTPTGRILERKALTYATVTVNANEKRNIQARFQDTKD